MVVHHQWTISYYEFSQSEGATPLPPPQPSGHWTPPGLSRECWAVSASSVMKRLIKPYINRRSTMYSPIIKHLWPQGIIVEHHWPSLTIMNPPYILVFSFSLLIHKRGSMIHDSHQSFISHHELPPWFRIRKNDSKIHRKLVCPLSIIDHY